MIGRLLQFLLPLGALFFLLTSEGHGEEMGKTQDNSFDRPPEMKVAPQTAAPPPEEVEKILELRELLEMMDMLQDLDVLTQLEDKK